MTTHELAKVLLEMDDIETDIYHQKSDGQLWDFNRNVIIDEKIEISSITVTTS